jgi:hypothetical protein
VQEAEVRDEIDDLLLAPVAAPGGPVCRQPLRPQRLLVALRVRAGREQEHDFPGRCLAGIDERPHPPRDVSSLREPPVCLTLAVRRLVGDEQLDRRREQRVGEAAGRLERLEARAELGTEELVHDREHLRARAVVLRQREHARARIAPLAEHLDVRVAEAVDRLELVADEEELLAAHELDELALQAVGVLELVDHDRAEAPAHAVPKRLVPAEQVAACSTAASASPKPAKRSLP